MRIIKINAKKAFTPTKIPGARYVINQYIGCQHACMYCYAKFMNKFYPYGKWGNWVVVKQNLPELVKRETVKGKVYMSSVSDAYQPIESKLRITRQILENMDKNIDLSILTKSVLMLRDLDLFKEFRSIEVGLTINGFDKTVKQEIESFSSIHKKRVYALKKLYDEGISNYAFISPIIPGLVDIEELILETKDFVNAYWFEFLNLKASGSGFKKWLKENFPESYKVVSNKSRFEVYIREVTRIIEDSKEKYDLEVRGIVWHKN